MFRLFAPLFLELDRVIGQFTGNAVASVMVAITPAVEASLVLWFTWWGFLVMRGSVHQPVREYLMSILRTSLILSFALGAGYYQSTVGEVIRTAPDDLAAAIMGESPLLYSLSNEEAVVGSSSSGAGTLIDVAAGKGIVAAMDAMRTGSIFDKKGLSLIAMGWCILISTVVMVAIGGANILVAKLVLAILVALGPIFIASLLFESTRRFFERWLAMVVTYALLLALFASFFTFLLSIFGHYVAQVKFDGTQNPGYSTAGAAILAMVSVVTLLEMKVLAMGLGGGVTAPRWGARQRWFAEVARWFKGSGGGGSGKEATT